MLCDGVELCILCRIDVCFDSINFNSSSLKAHHLNFLQDHGFKDALIMSTGDVLGLLKPHISRANTSLINIHVTTS